MVDDVQVEGALEDRGVGGRGDGRARNEEEGFFEPIEYSYGEEVEKAFFGAEMGFDVVGFWVRMGDCGEGVGPRVDQGCVQESRIGFFRIRRGGSEGAWLGRLGRDGEGDLRGGREVGEEDEVGVRLGFFGGGEAEDMVDCGVGD